MLIASTCGWVDSLPKRRGSAFKQTASRAHCRDFENSLDRGQLAATNNVSERELRPSVVFRKVTGGFRSSWGAQLHTGYRSTTSTAKLAGQAAWQAISELTEQTLIHPELPLASLTRRAIAPERPMPL